MNTNYRFVKACNDSYFNMFSGYFVYNGFDVFELMSSE